jgi:DHA1 family inner membrane transport protein
MKFEQRNSQMDIRLIWLALGSFAIGVEAFVVPSLLPSITADTGVSLIQGGYLVLAFALAYAFGSPVLAALTGTADRRNVLTVSALVFTTGAIIAGFAMSYGMLMGARIFMAFAAGLYAATAQATAVAISEPHHRARAISVIVGGTTMAVAFGAPLGALLASLVGWRGTYFAIAGLGVVAAGALWVMLPKGLTGVKLSLSERVAVVKVPGVLPALAVMMLYMTGGFTVFIYIAPLAINAIGLDKTMLPLILLSFGIGAAIGNILGGQSADRWGARQTVVAATIANGLALLVATLVPHWPHEIAGPALVVLMFVWGVVAWAMPPAQASRLLAMAPNSAPLVLSLNASALYLGIALGAGVGAQVLTYGSPLDLGWVGALFPTLALVILYATSPARVRLQAEPRLG